jgi:hypothetical protein
MIADYGLLATKKSPIELRLFAIPLLYMFLTTA